MSEREKWVRRGSKGYENMTIYTCDTMPNNFDILPWYKKILYQYVHHSYTVDTMKYHINVPVVHHAYTTHNAPQPNSLHFFLGLFTSYTPSR